MILREPRVRAHPGVLVPVMAGLLLTGCSGQAPRGSSAVSSLSSPHESTRSPGEGCREAPRAIVEQLEGGIIVRGATLSNLYVSRVGTTDGGSASLAPFVNQGWWVAGKVTGAGVRPEIGVWIVSGISGPGAAQVIAANAAAGRYSRWGLPGGDEISGPGRTAVETCVGAIPPA
jgi:hypothetical protein